MAQKDYPSNESLERIYKMLSGGADPSDTPGTLGQTAWQESLSKIAQLLEGSLGDASFDFPDVAAASSSSAGVAEFADADEANARYADAVDTKMLSPLSHHWAHEFGGIYVATGTVSQVLAQTTWTKVTGTFHAAMENSGAEITCDWNDDRIVVDEPSDYLAAYQISWWTWAGTTPRLQAQVYVNGTAQPQTRAMQTMGSSGTVSSISGVGMVEVVSGTYDVDLRIYASVAATMQIETAQLTITKMVGQ